MKLSFPIFPFAALYMLGVARTSTNCFYASKNQERKLKGAVQTSQKESFSEHIILPAASLVAT